MLTNLKNLKRPHSIEKLISTICLVLLALPVAANNKLTATVLHFDEFEAGVAPFKTRFIINGSLLRIDEGQADDSYILFDSKTGAIRSVTHSDQSILNIPAKSKLAVPALEKRFKSQELKLKTVNESDGPKVAGIQSIEYALFLGENRCAGFSSVEGLLVDELKLIHAYENALVINNSHNIANQPAEFVDDCMLANQLYAADVYLSKGFPVVYIGQNSKQRFLSNYKQGELVDETLFELPESYTSFSLDEKIGL